MSLLPLIFALYETVSDTVKEGFEIYRERKERKQYENIDFDNIASVTLDGIEPSYRIETEEEFDILSSSYLTDLDGWQHYETETLEYEVEDGNDYCFTIRYKDGTEIYKDYPVDRLKFKRGENVIDEKEEIDREKINN